MEHEKTLIKWWCWPALEKPLRSIFAWVVVFVAIALCAQWSFFIALGIGIALLSTLSEVLLPTLYKADSTALYVYALHMHQKILWSSVKTIQRDVHGFKLYFYTKGSKEKNLFLYCNSDKEKIGFIIEQSILRMKRE